MDFGSPDEKTLHKRAAQTVAITRPKMHFIKQPLILKILFTLDIFSPFGYHIVTKWKKHGVGQEYLSYLTEVDGLELYDEIPCGDLFEGNDPRERVMVFLLPHNRTENER